MLKKTQEELREKTLYWAGEIRKLNLHWETGIYPGEMAAFLALCDISGASSIIESGRGLHAYSTQVLGAYSNWTGASVVSIDLESDPTAAAECRRALARYSRVRCVSGDAFRVFPDVVAALPGKIAVLLDGPKEFAANKLSLTASLLFPIAAIGHHNCDPGLPWSDQFARMFPGAFHYEQLAERRTSDWAEFKAWEREAVRGYELPGNPGRSLSRSSIMLAEIPPGPRPLSLLRSLGSLRDQSAALRLYVQWQAHRAWIGTANS